MHDTKFYYSLQDKNFHIKHNMICNYKEYKIMLLHISDHKIFKINYERKEDQKSIMLISHYLLYFEFCCLSTNLVSRIKRPVDPEKNHKFAIFLYFIVFLHIIADSRTNNIFFQQQNIFSKYDKQIQITTFNNVHHVFLFQLDR